MVKSGQEIPLNPLGNNDSGSGSALERRIMQKEKTTVENEKNVYFSIITVCFNEEKTIGSTIESVLSQSYPFFEYIICDGGSSDRTYEIAQTYQDAFAKKNIRYTVTSQKDGGIYFGMNNDYIFDYLDNLFLLDKIFCSSTYFYNLCILLIHTNLHHISFLLILSF